MTLPPDDTPLIDPPWETSALDPSLPKADPNPVEFHTHFRGRMDMLADQTEVAAYLQAHDQWFTRCAQPMQVEPLGNNGYVLTIGRFGALGFEVEPKIAVVLEPPEGNQYLMHTVPLPEPFPLGYEVDYQAMMTLTEVPGDELDPKTQHQFTRRQIPLPDRLTQVQWELQMTVAVQFPSYIFKLPMKLIQGTGDRLLTEIVRQVSPRLTYKVQQDFHYERELPLPPKSGRVFQRVTETPQDEAVDE